MSLDAVQDIVGEDTAVKNDLDELQEQTYVSENASESISSLLPVTENTTVTDTGQQLSYDSSQVIMNTSSSAENGPEECSSNSAVEIAESTEAVTVHGVVALDSHATAEQAVHIDGVAAVDSVKSCVPNLSDILVESFTSSSVPKQITSTEASIGQQSATQNLAAATNYQLSSDHGIWKIFLNDV